MKTISHSSATTAKTCAKKYWFLYVQRIKPDRKSSALYIGTMIAQMTEINDLIDCPDIPSWCVYEEDIRNFEADYWFAASLFLCYQEYWGDDSLDIVKPEYEYQAPIYCGTEQHPTYLNVGKCDKLIRKNGKLALLETKTTSADISNDDCDYWTKLQLDQQITNYYVGLNASGQPVESIIYDVLRKPKLSIGDVNLLDENKLKIVLDKDGNRVYNKTGKKTPRQTADKEKGYEVQTRPETLEEFALRVTRTIQKNPSAYFMRKEVPRIQADLDEYAFELWGMADLLEWREATGVYERNTSACFHYNSKCEFYELCLNGWNPEHEEVPQGFTKKDRVHSELEKGGE